MGHRVGALFVDDGGSPGLPSARVERLNSCFCSKQVLGDHASLLSGTENFRLLNDDVLVLDKTVSVAARACGDSFRDDGVAPFANLIKLRFRGNFRRFRCSFGKGHAVFSSELGEFDSNFSRLSAKS